MNRVASQLPANVIHKSTGPLGARESTMTQAGPWTRCADYPARVGVALRG